MIESATVRPDSATLRPERWALALPGAYLLVVAAALIAVGLVVGTEQYPFLPRQIVYRLPLAQLEPIYYVALIGLAAHYVAYRRRRKTAPVAADTVAGPFRFSAAKFLTTWLFLVGLFGTYALGAAIATPALFDPVLGEARLTAGFRIWLHQFFALLLITGLVGGLAYYSTISILQRRKLSDVFRWVSAFLNLRKGHRFIGVLNWLLFVALLSNLTTGLIILGGFPLTGFRVVPFLPYGVENIVRIAHDVGTSLMVAALLGQGYYRLLPENRWMLRTTLGGDQPIPSDAFPHT